MNIKYRTTGLVFKKDERSESDQDFSVYTKDFGRLELRARAIRKITSKLRANIDIFYLSEIEFVQGKSRKTLTDAIKIKKFNNIASDIAKQEVIWKISDVLHNFIKGQEKDGETFDLLLDFLNNLENSQMKIKNNQLAYQYFFWNFISFQGYKLQVENCSNCQDKINPYNVYFSNKEGGIVCKSCSLADKDSKKINSDIVKILRIIFKKDWNTISKLKVELSSQKLLEDISENAIYAFCPS